jgi:hypothetical protein
MRRDFVLIMACLAMLLLPAAANAQYSIDWYTIDGGGGVSAGGIYELAGTIGQPDAGDLSGGVYTDLGGFWGVAVGDDCIADFAPPFGILNIFDFLAYQTAFGNGDPSADLAPPFGTLNLFDFLAYQTAFGNGC